LRKTATPPEDDTDDDPHTGPQRRCLVTRESFLRETMLRFVVGPEGQVVFDVAATLPGRGMWLSASGDVVDMAVKRGVFARAAKAQVKTPPDLRSVIESRLRARVGEFLGLARRSGAAISGFETAREWLVAGKAGLVVQAADGSAEERSRFVGSRQIPVVAVLTAAELGKVFGRDHAVHVAIASGRLARMIEVEAARLAGVAGGGTSGHTAQRILRMNGPDQA
jgi:predicted RNA-binding protein YlxR (DUF448 family)/ribosomal protein L30E